jgi:hypothetical protein
MVASLIFHVIKQMKFQDSVKKPTSFLAMTGCHLEEFNDLLPHFTTALSRSKYTLEGKERQNQSTSYQNSPLPSSEDKLFFILVYIKQYPTQELMGASFDLSQPKANLWIHFLTPLLEEALTASKLAPSRERDESTEGKPSVYSHDGVEREIQRPKKDQKTYYSGKKKTHTIKNNVLADASCTVIF